MVRCSQAEIEAILFVSGGPMLHHEGGDVADKFVGTDAFENERGARIEAAGLADVRRSLIVAGRRRADADQALWRPAAVAPVAALLSGRVVVAFRRVHLER